MTQVSSGVRLSDRYEATAGRVQLTGIHALARLPIEQHRRDLAHGLRVATMITGYEGSPLGGYDLELTRQGSLLEANDITIAPALNEESAATAIQGTQLVRNLEDCTRDGVIGIWYGKAPGLDRASDAIRHGNLMGAHPTGGALLLVGDDPAAKSSTLPCSSEFALHDLSVPILAPADSQDVLDLGLHAIEISRDSGLWVALKIATAIADGSSTVELGRERPDPVIPDGAKTHTPTSRLLQPALTPLERDVLDVRTRLASEYAGLNNLNRVYGRTDDDRIGIVAAGRTFLEVSAALARLGINPDDLDHTPVRLLRVGMPYPLNERNILDFADGLDELLIVEEKRSFMESTIRSLLYDEPNRPRITGKKDPREPLVPAYGDLDADNLTPLVRRRLEANQVPVTPPPSIPAVATQPDRLPLVSRAPYFCSGCPHNSSTQRVEGALVGAGIGCHALVLMMDDSQVGNVTGLAQMGGEGLQWLGMARYTDTPHYVQNLGDGTFDHSGSLAIRAAVASGHNLTYKLLYNSAVAMTGGQQAVGGMSVRQIVDVLLAEGVARVIVTTEDLSRYRGVRMPRGVKVWPRDRLEEAQRILADTAGVTVLVHDQQCATEKRRQRKRGTAKQAASRIFINERVCEGCGDCGRKSNCLSVHPVPTEFGRKTQIHQTSCNLDESCIKGDCPAFLRVRVPANQGAREDLAAPLDAAELPVPDPSVPADAFGVRLMGIGGTGVVTVSQMLANAGMIAGWQVRSLDMTGLAQKGGAVISDVRFARHQAAPTNKLGAGECDLYLACDLMVGADSKNLTVVSPDTVAVVSTTHTPTGRMVSDPRAATPTTAALLEPITDKVARERTHHLDVRELCLRLFGGEQYANLLLTGVAYQSGALPLPPEAIEEAIRLNGVAVEANIQAFRRGRQFVADPGAAVFRPTHQTAPAPEHDVTDVVHAEPGSELARLVAIRSQELVAYQDLAYARRYTAFVEQVRRLESMRTPGRTGFSEQVARHLHKLMAYKDEYEVARLSLGDQLRTDLAQTFGPHAKAQWLLQPPMLRAMGLDNKVTLGSWFAPALRGLNAVRRLRGTAMDPFAMPTVRRVERELITEYESVIRAVALALTPCNHDLAVEIAHLPDLVRGYEEVKLANVAQYRARLSELVERFRSSGIS